MLNRTSVFRLPGFTQPRPWLTNLALGLFGAALIEFCRIGVGETRHFVLGFSRVALCQALIYLAAVWVVLNNPANRWTFLLILGFAAGCRLVCLFPPPHLSSDVYRYVWDGRVQAAGINPYRYIPADAHLAFLRDHDIYPNINRRNYAHTIYPPAAQMLFFLVARIGHSVVAMKAAMVSFEGLTVWALLKLLAVFGYRRERVLIYAWHPLLFWEVAGSGHVDAAAVAFLTLALLFSVRHKAAATGIALAVAALIKLYPIALFPALHRRRDWKMPLCGTAVIAAGYACYASVGRQVLGFLPSYAREEGMESGRRYFLLTLTRHLFPGKSVPTAAFYGCAGLLLIGLALWARRREERDRMAPVRGSFAIAAVLMLLLSPHYPWYYEWLLPFLCVILYVPMLYFTTACFYLYTTSLAAPGPAMDTMFAWLYGTLGLLALWSLSVDTVHGSRARIRPAAQPELYETSARK